MVLWLRVLRRLVVWLLYVLRQVDRWLRRRRALWRWGARRCQLEGGHRYAEPKPAWVQREVVKLKALLPQAGCRMIAHHFNRRFAVSRCMTVGKTYVAYTLRREQYAILCTRRRIKHALPRRVPRNLIWGLDLAVKTDSAAQPHLLLVVVDHASRACLLLQQLPRKSAWMLLTHLVQALKSYGRPRYLRTDNEGACTSWLFRLALWLLGVQYQRTAPLCPWQNGRVERLIGTLKAALTRWRIEDSQQLEHTLHQVRIWYNHLRPHQHLQGRTPAEVWAGVDVFADTPQAAAWRKQWERSFRRHCRSAG